MASWLARSFLSAAQKRLFRTGVPVFMLHKIGKPPPGTREPFDYLTAEGLDSMLAALHHAGFSPATLDDFVAQRVLMGSSFIVTFDDGYRNVVEEALPVLARHRVKAVQFLVADRLGGQNDWDMAKGEVKEPLMTKEEVVDWLAAGHAIGSHTSSHPNLKHLTLTRAREEIAHSRRKLEDTFGVSVNHFSYPSGKFNGSVLDLVREAGYQSACTVEFGVNVARTSPFELMRISPLSAGQLFKKACHRLMQRLRQQRAGA